MAGAITGDFHYGCTMHSGIDPATLLPSRLIDTENTIRQLFQIAHEMNLNWLIIMGDLFHKNSPPSTYIARFIALMREMLDKYGIHVFAFDGNHDFNGKQGQRNATAALVEALRGHAHFTWIDKPTLVPFGSLFNALVIPHKTWHDECALQLPSDKPGVVVGHWAIEGAVTGVEDTLLADEADELGNVLGRIDAYWSGHVHKSQAFLYKGTQVRYPGSIERIDFGERDDEKRFVAVRFNEGDDDTPFTYENVPLETRRFIQVTQNVDERWTPEAVFWPECKDAILKIKVKGKESDSDRFIASQVRDYIMRNLEPAYLTGFDMDWERERQVRDDKMTERLTIGEAFVRYAERNLARNTQQEIDFHRRVTEVGTRIIREATARAASA